MDDDAPLTKIHVELPNHWATSGESMWARHVGGDLYEIRNVPFYAYGLNFLDIVEAVAPSPDLKPMVRAVRTRSGHTTMRVIFLEDTDADEAGEMLRAMASMHVTFEGVSDSYYALDVEPEGDAQKVLAHLKDLEARGILEYETCEHRVEGSFDDAPDDEE